MEQSSNLVFASCRQYPQREELLKSTGAYWTLILSTLAKRDDRYPVKKAEVLQEIMRLIQDDQLEMTMLMLTSCTADLVNCNPSYLCSKKTGAVSEDKKR